MSGVAIHLLIVFNILIAPLLTVTVVRLIQPGPLTHHQNAQGTYDRNLWLRAISPLLTVGREEEQLLWRATQRGRK